ncbi:hypothetical protein R5W23_000775 [Gemmata sp. JC673]|uniref:YfhO family protein n=1 Tax=Gemmata algarum TaxID=2975278 RepID=A0ABU5ES76_9BACT|nr:hypothetical protein [Gemmata algarum]MDY3558055.1 hypothetical protein [Gemmata algarum]
MDELETSRPRFGPWGWGLIVAAFAAGFWNFPLQVVGRELTHVPGDLVDNRLNLCVLEHGYRYVRGEGERFWDIGTFYPVKGVTAWSDAHIGMLPLYSGLRACGLSPERAFQGWFLIPFALNFAAAVWGARRLGLGPVGAAAAAFVFTYGMPLAAQGGHSQLVPRFLVPPALALLWAWLRDPHRTRPLALCAACAVYQTYISVYIGYLLVLTLAGWVLAALALSRGRWEWRAVLRPGGRVWAARGGAAAAALVAVWPLVDAHRRNGSELPRDHVHTLAPRLPAWITPPGMTEYYSDLAKYTGMGSTMTGAGEEQLFPGVLPLGAVGLCTLLAVVVLCRRWTPGPVTVAAVAALSSVALALLVTKFGPQGETWLYEPLLKIPGASGVRATSRIVLVLLFPAGVALGVLLDRAVRCVERWRFAAAALAALALAVVAADQRLTGATGERSNDWWWARYPLAECVSRRTRVAEAVRAHPNPKLVYAFPAAADRIGAGGPVAMQPDIMLGVQQLGLPTANGWSGRHPVGWGFPSTYSELLAFFKAYGLSDEDLSGLVILGEPAPGPDPAFERAARARHQPVPIPVP